MTIQVPPMTLPTLLQEVQTARPALLRQGRLMAYPFHWQVPAATEQAAYEAMRLEARPDDDFDFVALPWATLIDGLRGGSDKVLPILKALRALQQDLAGAGTRRRATVAQHIHALQFPELFTALGITDVFWSHAVVGQELVDGMRVHPFPLFPAQTANVDEHRGEQRPIRYLANFIGAYSAGLYLSNVRKVIYDDAGASSDVLIIKRDAWHFDRAVYEEQVQGVRASADRLAQEREHAREYLQAIRESWFTLCPTGSGPNSIRIFESLCLGSIPIILTRSLRWPGSGALWERAALFEEDSESGYRRALARARSMSLEQRRQMVDAGRQLSREVLPPAYGRLIRSQMLGLGDGGSDA